MILLKEEVGEVPQELEHSTLLKLKEELDTLREELAPKKSQLRLFHELPPVRWLLVGTDEE